MARSASYEAFLSDKKQLPIHALDSKQASKLVNRAGNKSYAFLAENRDLIQQEFDHLFTLFKRTEKPSDRLKSQVFHYATLLSRYHYKREEFALVEKYNNRARLIQGTIQALPTDEDSPVTTWLLGLIGKANMQRIDIAFNRATVKQSLIVAKQLESVANFLNIDGMISMLDAPTPYFNFASIGLFVARLSINMSQIIQHTLLPKTGEIDPEFSAFKRFFLEVSDKQYHLLNDVVWGVVNFVCNYNTLSGASDLLASQITSAFLVFDALWLAYKLYLMKQTYETKKAQYMEEIASATEGTDAHRELTEQLYELDKQWEQDSAEYFFSIAAAAVFTAGFSATLIFASPVAIAACYFVCITAVAMYLSADEYGKWAQASFVLNSNAEPKESAEKARVDARNDFYLALAKHIFMPLCITTGFAISWPITLTGVILYYSYDYASKMNKEVPHKAVNESMDRSSDDEPDDSLVPAPGQ